MWSIGMVMHVLMNPELGCPYCTEAEQLGVADIEAVCEKSSGKRHKIRETANGLLVAT